MWKRTKRAKATHGNLGLTGIERTFGADELIVTKTDTKGRITYANRLFCELAGYKEAEVMGAPHNIIRHPHMPRCVFRLLWETLEAGNEIFAYVVNRSRNGDHYWVLAHVTPSYDANGKIMGYHSNRRVANPRLIREIITPLYAKLREEEAKHQNPKAAATAGMYMLQKILEERSQKYDEFVFSLVRTS